MFERKKVDGEKLRGGGTRILVTGSTGRHTGEEQAPGKKIVSGRARGVGPRRASGQTKRRLPSNELKVSIMKKRGGADNRRARGEVLGGGGRSRFDRGVDRQQKICTYEGGDHPKPASHLSKMANS